MKYFSTRGNSPELNFEEAVFQGLAPDGGLYLPMEIPHFNLTEIDAMIDCKFEEIAFKIYRRFIDSSEISDADLQSLCQKSFATFSTPLVTPTRKLKSPNNDKLWILELFHGPTFAFKDVALQFLGNLFEYFLKRRNLKSKTKHFVNVVGATSGDTGGAAIYGLRGKENVNVFILHPHKRISPVQELQMTSVMDSNVYNITIEGTFDDCQDIVKALFNDPEFKSKYQLGAINSINWARILAQTTYYFASYFSVAKQMNYNSLQSFIEKESLQFSVPSGNFGDVLAGFFAKSMGLPINRFIVATNENDILDRFLKTGRYEKSSTKAKDPVKMTLSPAMDILISSNFERLLWYLLNSENGEIKKSCSQSSREASSRSVNLLMEDLKSVGGFAVNENVLKLAQSIFDSSMVSDVDTQKTIQEYFISTGYVLDPHTAVGVKAAERISKQNPSINTVCLSTASPGKFPEAVLGAINIGDSQVLRFEDFAPKALVELNGLPQRMTMVHNNGDQKKALADVRRILELTLKI